jgi:hypothetical protein
MANFGDFQNGVYAEAVKGVTTRTRSTLPRSNAKRLRRFRIGCIDMSRRPQVMDGPSARTLPRSLAMASCPG